MNPFRRLLRYLRPEVTVLIFAYVCMIALGAATAAYAFLAGPALKFVFSGSLTDIMRTADGRLRSLWQWLPASFLANLERFTEHSALYVVPALIVAVALIKGLAQTGQFYLMGKVS